MSRPVRKTVRPSRYGHGTDCGSAPSVGSTFRILSGDGPMVDRVNAGGLLLRLAGHGENTGMSRYRLLPFGAPGEHFADYPSLDYLARRCEAVVVVTPEEQVVLSDLLNDPPDDGLWFRAVRPEVVMFSSLSGGASLRLALCPLAPSRDLRAILHDNPRLPALPLDHHHHQYRTIARWKLVAVNATTCVIYGSAESVLRRRLRREHPFVSAVALMRLVRHSPVALSAQAALLRGSSGLLPTVPCSSHYHPIILGEMRFPSIYSYLELFGISFTDPLAVYLVRLAGSGIMGCHRALSSLCQGVSGHSVCTLLATIRAASPISSVSSWLVATSFSGVDTFWCHVRALGLDCTLVAASERSRSHRLGHEANHPGLAVFPTCVSDASVTAGMPKHHLRFAGFPCVEYSRLRRGVTTAILRYSLDRFDFFLDSLRVFAPPVVILENVASLLDSGLDWVRDHIESGLRRLAAGRYQIFRDVLCCGGLGARFVRPRVYWLMYLA